MKEKIREIYTMEVQKAEKDDIGEWEQEMVLSALEGVKEKMDAQEYGGRKSRFINNIIF